MYPFYFLPFGKSLLSYTVDREPSPIFSEDSHTCIKVEIGNDQEMAQSERKFNSKNRGGKTN